MLDTLARLRDVHGYLLVADEVATGFGRTGTYFASERWPVRPDVMIVSKGITNGTCAVAAVVVSHEICERFERSDAPLTHAETQAGTPGVCAAIMATIEQMTELDAVRRGQWVAGRLTEIIADLSGHPLVTGDQGMGCFRAVRLGFGGEPLDAPGIGSVIDAVHEAGAVIQPGPGCVQLVPALVYDGTSLERLARAVRTGFDSALETIAKAREGTLPAAQ
jgi:adenosylmethionine-8-amino-7-oxononanoate aminotransferase